MAMAAHRYVRATQDVDLGACTSFFPKLREFYEHLRSSGYRVELRWPEDGDPLDGVLDIERDGAVIQVVNIANSKLGRAAIDNAEELDIGLRCVRLEELIALKLYAGGKYSMRDIQELLDANPEADLTRIGNTCDELRLGKEWKSVLEARGE
ncbi:MAG: hypothetical protein RIT81_17870 [Deltaproteobacteria bacterium]